MDDRYSEYVIAVGELCAAAELARFHLEVVTTDGRIVLGLAGAPRTATGDGELDHTGLQRTVRVDGSLVNLDEIVRCTIHRPEESGSRCNGGPALRAAGTVVGGELVQRVSRDQPSITVSTQHALLAEGLQSEAYRWPSRADHLRQRLVGQRQRHMDAVCGTCRGCQPATTSEPAADPRPAAAG